MRTTTEGHKHVNISARIFPLVKSQFNFLIHESFHVMNLYILCLTKTEQAFNKLYHSGSVLLLL